MFLTGVTLLHKKNMQAASIVGFILRNYSFKLVQTEKCIVTVDVICR
jgi:hypothetical protein